MWLFNRGDRMGRFDCTIIYCLYYSQFVAKKYLTTWVNILLTKLHCWLLFNVQLQIFYAEPRQEQVPTIWKYILKLGRNVMRLLGQQLWLPLEKYGEVGRGKWFSLVWWLHCSFSFSISSKDVFNMQGEWPTSNILPSMVHS